MDERTNTIGSLADVSYAALYDAMDDIERELLQIDVELKARRVANLFKRRVSDELRRAVARWEIRTLNKFDAVDDE